jgi:CDP-4-dehydro-6-deoxyglucose reductase
MPYIVHIKPSGILLSVNDGETVLEAALRAGFDFPYSCGSATCGTCKGKILSGQIDYGTIKPYALSDDETDYALFCSAKPRSDLIIEMEEVYTPYYKPPQKFDYHIRACQTASEDGNIMAVTLSPVKKNLSFVTGQYLYWIESKAEFAFSIANAPTDEGTITLYIQRVPGNQALDQLWQHLRVEKEVVLKGPFGNMVLHSTLENMPLTFIALGGVSIAPLKALIEEALTKEHKAPLHLYWQVQSEGEAYLKNYFDALQKQHPQFSWKISTNAAGEIEKTEGAFYVIGKSEIVLQTAKTLKEKGVNPALILSDTFERASFW